MRISLAILVATAVMGGVRLEAENPSTERREDHPLAVRLVPSDEILESDESVSVVAVEGDQVFAKAERLAPWRFRFVPDVPRDAVVTCVGAGVWCPEVSLGNAAANSAVRDTAGAIELPAWPSRQVALRLSVPQGEDAPTEVALQARIPDRDVVWIYEEQHAVADNRLTTTLPATRVDLRIAAQNWAPLYRFGFPPGPQSLGRWRLVRGASVAGIVRHRETGFPLEEVSVRLEPAGELPRTERERRNQLFGEPTRTSEYGFFQVAGLPEGVYELSLSGPGLTEAKRTIEVREEAETFFGALEIGPAVSVVVEISPPVDPEGLPWVVKAVGEEGDGFLSALTDEEGRAHFLALPLGQYLFRLTTTGADGYLWSAREEIVDSTELLVELDLVRLRGQVTLDNEPLATQLSITTGSGDQLSISTDEEGRFEGLILEPTHEVLVVTVSLPRDESSDRGQATAQRIVRDPEISSGELILDLALENRQISGLVFAEAGGELTPATNTRVSIREEGTYLAHISARTDSAGHFSVRGLSAGRYEVRAVGRESSSRTVVADLESSREVGDLELRLESKGETKIRVLSGAGQPVAGALVKSTSIGGAGHRDRETTDLEGIASLDVSPDANALSLVIHAYSAGLLWTGCVELSDRDRPAPLDVLLPNGAGSELGISGDLGLLHGDFVGIVSETGGVLSPEDVDQWRQRVAPTRPPIFKPGSTAPGVAPGLYTAVRAQGRDALIRRACTLKTALASDWRLLAPGGSLILESRVRHSRKSPD